MGNDKIFRALLGIAAAMLVVVIMFLGYLIFINSGSWPGLTVNFNGIKKPRPVTVQPGKSQPIKMAKFSSEEEFKNYLIEGEAIGYGYGGFGGMVSKAMPVARQLADVQEVGLDYGTYTGLGTGELAQVPGRVSETNVQVLGVDEPDILKTDGQNIYYAQESYYGPVFRTLEESDIMPYPDYSQVTRVIDAFPPADLKQIGKIEEAGNLLLSGKTLMVFTYDRITGYNVSDPANPSKLWTVDYENNNYLVQARLYKNELYLVMSSYVSRSTPCPIVPLKTVEGDLSIRCVDVYHPVEPLPVDVTYTAAVINIADGKVKESTSFVGSSSASVVYMSTSALYATYSYSTDMAKFMFNFFNQEMADLVSKSVRDKLSRLASYDISNQSKLTEIQLILEEFYGTLNEDERLKLENETQNRMSDYLKVHRRELERTGIVKIGLDNFKIQATGDVAGSPLNQFSLDEYQNTLRVATTLGQNFGLGAGGESVSDVTVLDKDLKYLSSVQDLGKTERIYSVRFIEDKGYVVTFRQTDPFYVIDLSNPKKAELKGELKIPGFSSYLHPIAKDRILGVGRESSNVKISLFDVSDAANPQEADKYILDEYWSEALDTHHAFLQDSEHQVFFLPGSQGGYVFSYRDDKLTLERAVSGIVAKRALYLDNYLYIVGDDKIVILNEADWKEVNELEF